MSDTWQIMVASSDLENRRHLVSILDRQGIRVRSVPSNVGQCREVLDGHDVGLVFCDRSFADGDYRDVLAAAEGKSRGRRRVSSCWRRLSTPSSTRGPRIWAFSR